MIQGLNKKTKIGIFDKNDELISEILCKMIYNQLKQSMEFSDFANYDYKLKKLLNTVHKFYLEDNILKLINCCAKILKTLFSTENVQIFFLNPEDDDFYKSYNGEMSKVDINKGIIGHVFSTKKHLYCHSAYNDDYFNPIIDIDSSLPLITFPVVDKSNSTVLAVLQIEYTMNKITLGDVVDKKIDSMDLDIIGLLAVNMGSSLSHLKFKIKQEKEIKGN